MRFLLVDAIRELESGVRATGIKNVTMSEDFLADHFPNQPIMPGALVLEALVQLADWLVREVTDFQCLGLASSFERIKFRKTIRPGDQLYLEVLIKERNEQRAQIQGKAHCQDKLVTSANFTLTLQPMDLYLDPQEARKSFRLLYMQFTEVQS